MHFLSANAAIAGEAAQSLPQKIHEILIMLRTLLNCLLGCKVVEFTNEGKRRNRLAYFVCKLRSAVPPVLLLCLTFACFCLAPLAVSAQGPVAISEEILTTAHVSNFAKVSPTLWRGA
jgi:hypothetical protein